VENFVDMALYMYLKSAKTDSISIWLKSLAKTVYVLSVQNAKPSDVLESKIGLPSVFRFTLRIDFNTFNTIKKKVRETLEKKYQPFIRFHSIRNRTRIEVKYVKSLKNLLEEKLRNQVDEVYIDTPSSKK